MHTFDWDDANLDHIAKHGLEPEEVEETFYNRSVPSFAYNAPGEKRCALIGVTDAGHILYVVYTRRARHIRVVTARDAKHNEKRRFRR